MLVAAVTVAVGVPDGASGRETRAEVTGLVAAYSFDAGAGTTVADASGNGHTGTISGATWSAGGKSGAALSFDGVNDSVTVGDSALLDLTTGMTLEAWVRPRTLGTVWRTILFKEQPGELVYALYAGSSTSVPAGIVFTNGAERQALGTAQIALNTWTHLAATYNGAAVALYVNGTLARSVAASGAMPNSTGAFKIGGNSVWGEWFDGFVDDVRVYNRALTVGEIQADMNAGVGSDTSPPSAPTNLVKTGATGTSISVSWTASTDNVGVASYGLYRNSTSVGTTTATSATFGGLQCGTTYTLGVDAADAAGNRSAQATLTAATVACDVTAPSAPTNLSATGATATTITVSWSASNDDVGVAGYGLYRNGANVGTSTLTSATFTGLTCGTTYTLGADAFDAAGNRSAQTTTDASTDICDVVPPTVSITAPAQGATVSGPVTVSADASDDVGVASVEFRADGAALGPPDTTPPYSASWSSTSVPNGPHDLSAVARDAAGNASAPAVVTVNVANAFDTTNAAKRIVVGPGFVDASARQLIRTPGNRVYVFASDDTASRQQTGPGVIRAWRGNATGIPTAFAEMDGANRPSATGSLHVLGSPDVRLDAAGIAHLAFANETDATLVYKTFSTITDTWGPSVVIATGVTVPTSFIKRESSSSIVLDSSDTPHVVYVSGTTVRYRNRVGGTWGTTLTVATGTRPLHPQLAAEATGAFHLSWLDDATSPAIRYNRRAPDGTWGATETVAGSDVLSNSNSDQGPSVVVTPAGVPYVLYVSALPASAVRVKYRDGTGWAFDNPPTNLYTHTPQIYANGGDIYTFLGHDVNIHFGYTYRLSGQPWSAYTPLTLEADDGSASVRYDPQRETNAGIIDVSFFDEDKLANSSFLAELYYMAVVPTRVDTTPPAVSITAPLEGEVVADTVAVAAAASDDTGVAGVQFRLDDAALGAEDTSAPFSVDWDTTAAPNGSHTLTAVVRDTSGNRTTSAQVGVTVSNVDTTPPSAPALSFSGLVNTSVTGLTVYYRPAAADGSFIVDASSSDPQSGIVAYTFPPAGLGWTASCASAGCTYAHAGAPTDPSEPNDIVATNGAGLVSPPTSFEVTPDETPAVTSPSCNGGACAAIPYTTRPVSLTLAATDGGAGVNEIRYTLDGTDPGPLNGAVYAGAISISATTTVKYRAYDRVGNEEAVATQLVLIDTTPPAVPTGLVATGGIGSVSLDWADNTDSDLLSYRVYRRNGDGSFSLIATTSTSAYTQTGLSAATTFTYRVTAIDRSSPANESAPSATASATTASTKTYQPTGYTILTGTVYSNRGAVSRLFTNDAVRVEISAVLVGSTYISDIYVRTVITAAERSTLRGVAIDFDGNSSASDAWNTLSVYDWSLGTWLAVDGPKQYATTDRAFSWSAAASPARYVSSSGEIRFRVRATRSAAFRTRTDLVRFTIDF